MLKNVSNFHTVTKIMMESVGPVLKFMTYATESFKEGDWKLAGEYIGEIFNIIVEYSTEEIHQ